jgi:hypothetical protein
MGKQEKALGTPFIRVHPKGNREIIQFLKLTQHVPSVNSYL